MKIAKLALLATTLAVAFTAPLATQAASTYERVETRSIDLEGVQNVNFSKFDRNHDGVLTRKEVGYKMFDLFDQDGNDQIDNIEWNLRNVMTISPYEKVTYRFVDYNDDGRTEETTYTRDEFYKASGLARFDKNRNGLSAREFIGVPYRKLDTDNNGRISYKEWERVYNKKPFDYDHNDNARYNR